LTTFLNPSKSRVIRQAETGITPDDIRMTCNPSKMVIFITQANGTIAAIATGCRQTEVP
jgi:hypothetical protein